MSILFDSTNGLLNEMIQATALRHRVLAANLANVETPGFQAQDVTFAHALEEARSPGKQGAGGPQVRASVGVDPDATARRDGNSLDLDQQMVKLTRNTTWHTAMIQMLTSRLTVVKAAMGK